MCFEYYYISMKRNNSAFILIVILCMLFLSLGFYALKKKGEEKPPVIEPPKNDIVDEVNKETAVIDSVGQENKIFLYGTLKKESIPEELELGDLWFWLYFDEPHLLVNNASGVPLYIDKIQVNPPEGLDIYNLDDFTDKKVEIYGYQTWGYAESSVFQAMSIREY